MLGVGGTGKTRLAMRYGRSWLGKFLGGVWFCDLASARSVDGITIALSAWDDAPQTVDAVQALVDKSFVRARDGMRIDLLVSVQAHAHEHLHTEGRFAGSGDAAMRAAQARHARWFASLDPDDSAGGDCADLDNLAVACRRAVVLADAPTAASTLEGAWAALSLHGPFKAGLELAELLVAMPSRQGASVTRVQIVLAKASEASGRSNDSHRHAAAALALAQQSGNRRCQAEATLQLSQLLARSGQYDQARAMLGQAGGHARSLGNRRLECAVLNAWGKLKANFGRPNEARLLYQAALALAAGLPHRFWHAVGSRPGARLKFVRPGGRKTGIKSPSPHPGRDLTWRPTTMRGPVIAAPPEPCAGAPKRAPKEFHDECHTANPSLQPGP